MQCLHRLLLKEYSVESLFERFISSTVVAFILRLGNSLHTRWHNIRGEKAVAPFPVVEYLSTDTGSFWGSGI